MKEHTHLLKDQNQVRVVGREGANDFTLLPEGDNDVTRCLKYLPP